MGLTATAILGREARQISVKTAHIDARSSNSPQYIRLIFAPIKMWLMTAKRVRRSWSSLQLAKNANKIEMVMRTISNTALPREAHVGTFFRAVGKTIGNWWIHYINWRLEQFAIARLRAMSDRELKDIGVPRAAIESLVKGTDRHLILNA